MVASTLRSWLCFVALTASAAAQSVTWLEGAQPTDLTLKSVPEATPSTPPTTLLSGVELLEIEITGRTQPQELDASRTRRITRNGVTRIELPGGHRLFAYRRNAGQTYGYFALRADGSAIVLLERAAALGQSPFADRLAVSADGAWGTVDTLDGSLQILRLDGTTFASTGTPRRTVRLSADPETATMSVGRSHVFFATEDNRIWRCALADGSVPEDISPPAVANPRIGSEFALSGDGSTAACIYGVRNATALWLLHESRPTVRLAAPNASYEEPGYLPETANGPRMLLNQDGSRLMYTANVVRDEIFLLDTTGTSATTQVTADHNFQPYIGIGIFPAFAGSVLILGVGDIDRFDVFAALTGDAPVANLTQTAGNVTRPWQAGGLVPQTMALSSSGQILVVEGSAPAMRGLRVDPITGTNVLLGDQITDLPQLAGATNRGADVELASSAGDQLVDSAFMAPVLTGPAGLDLHDSLRLPGDWRVLVASVGGLSALVFRGGDGSLVALPAIAGDLRLALTARGSLLLDGPTLQLLNPAGLFTVPATGAVRLLLTGAGA